MNDDDFAVRQLPTGRTGARIKWLADASATGVALAGLVAYLIVVLLFSGAEIVGLWLGMPMVVESGPTATAANTWQIVYFNFITILTIGYGDLIPTGLGRWLAITEAIAGTGVIGITIAALTAKFLSPPPDSVVFSRYGYYCTEDEYFLLIYVNTTKNLLINAETSSYFKLGGDWGVTSSIRSPFITQSVQTFLMNHVRLDRIVELLTEGDALRFGIDGRIGGTALSVAIQYPPEEIIVLPNRNELISYDGFWKVDFRSPQLADMFHYRPAGAPTLLEYVTQQRKNNPQGAAI